MWTHPPTRLGEVLLELLGDGGVDVPLALLPSDPAVLEGIAGNTKMRELLKTLGTKSERTINDRESEGSRCAGVL